MNRGYVKVWRKIHDDDMLKNHKYCAFFLWALTKASHKRTDIIVGNQCVKLEPGQFVFGRRMAARELGMTEREIRTIIELAKKADFLTIKTTNKYSIITIINWHIYQGLETDERPSKRPASDQQATTNKNVKNVKNKYMSDSTESGLADFLLQKILSRNPGFKKPNMQQWARDIDLMIRIDHRRPEDIQHVIEWCQNDRFWQNNILSTAKLRKQFDQLRAKMESASNISRPLVQARKDVQTVRAVTCPSCGRSVLSTDLDGEICIICAEVRHAQAGN